MGDIDKKLFTELAKIEKDKIFIGTEFIALDTDEKKKEMIDFIKYSDKKLKKSDIYLKELQINKNLSKSEWNKLKEM